MHLDVGGLGERVEHGIGNVFCLERIDLVPDLLGRLGAALGCHAATFSGLAGLGDLVLTCTGRQSRNHAVGERIGRGESLQAILSGMRAVAASPS